MIVIYFLVAISATIFGSLVGLGGGVIIKPVLDTIGTYNLATVGVLSSFTVFSMAVVSTIKQIRKGFKVERNMLVITLGSILGGGIGSSVFKSFMAYLNNEELATAIQSGILGTLLILVLCKNYFPKYQIKNNIVIFVIGLILGTIASFLGVGGGPINVMILVVAMSMDMKKAAVTSILIILLSQFTKLFLMGIGTGFGEYNLSMLTVMIPGGILGGFVGAHFNSKLTQNTIQKIFNVAISLLILLNAYNVISNL